MEIINKIDNGPVLIKPTIYKDDRGYFYESFNNDEFCTKIENVTFVQDNESCSHYGVLRGMHFQKGEYAQAKLVRVVEGSVLDVVVDIRPLSPNRGKAYAYFLSEKNHHQLFIPRGFAHGFLTLSERAVFQYKCDNVYNKESQGSFKYDTFGFDWQSWIDPKDIVVSEKDGDAPDYSNDGIFKERITIEKEQIHFLINKSITDAALKLTIAVIGIPAEELFADKIFAEILSKDGEVFTAKLYALLPIEYNPASFMPTRKIECIDERNSKHFVLSEDFKEVRSFYKYK